VSIDSAIAEAEDVVQLLFQPLQVVPQVSLHYTECFLDRSWAVVREGCDDDFGRRVGRDVIQGCFVTFDNLGNIRSSEDRGAHGARAWHLILLLHDGEDRGL